MYASVLETPLGKLLIRADDEHVTSILFRDEEPNEVPNVLTHIAGQELLEYFNGQRRTFSFPFRQEGTPFSQSVWDELTRIPAGSPTSYLALSKRLKNPLAIRAVASANGRNNLTIVVPCHRVIGSNGELVGYSGGLWRKQWLLDHEAKMTGKGQGTLF